MWKVARFAASRLSRSPAMRRFSTAIPRPCIVHKRGADILHDPWFNKDNRFPLTERVRLGLRGLLPPRIISFEPAFRAMAAQYTTVDFAQCYRMDPIGCL